MSHFLPDSVTLPKSRMAAAQPRTHYLPPKLATGAQLMFNQDLLSLDEDFNYLEKGFRDVDYYYFFDSVKCYVDTGRRYHLHEDVDGDENPMISKLWLWEILRDAPWATCTSFLHIGCYTGYLNFVAAFSMGPNKVNHGLETDYKSFLGCRWRANEINACFPKLREKISFPHFFNCHYSELQPHRRYSFIMCSCETTMEDRNAIINSLLEPGGELVILSERKGVMPCTLDEFPTYHLLLVERGRERAHIVRRSQKPTNCIVDLREVPSLFDMSASAVSKTIMARIPVEDEDCNHIIADLSFVVNSRLHGVEHVKEQVERVYKLLDRLCLPTASNNEILRIIEEVTFRIQTFCACVFNKSALIESGCDFLERERRRLARLLRSSRRSLHLSEFISKYKAIVRATEERSSPQFQNRWEKYISKVKKLTGVPKPLQNFLYVNIDLTQMSS